MGASSAQSGYWPAIWVGLAMIAGFVGTALISPLYPIYKVQWGLQVSDVTNLYIIYMMGAFGAFVFFGKLADRMGYRALLLIALAASLLGSVCSMLAPDLPLLLLGRFLVGAASSIITSAGTVALTALIPPAKRGVLALVMGLLISAGFGLGPLLGGVMGQWAADPLFTTYVPAVVFLLVTFAGVWKFVPEAATGKPALSASDFIPKLTLPDAGDGSKFLVASGFPFMAFGMFGIYASLSPLFIKMVLGWDGALVSGSSIAFILFASSIIQIFIRNMDIRHVSTIGLIAMSLSIVTLIANLELASIWLFALSLAMTSIGHSFAMLAGISKLQSMTGDHNRAGLTSSYLMIGYMGAIAPLYGVGWISDKWGMDKGLMAFGLLTIGLASAVMLAKRKVYPS